ILDNFYAGKRETVAPFKGRIDLVVGDVRNPSAARRAVRGVSYVLHQAAMRSVPRSIAAPEECNSINVDGTLNMLIAAHKANVKRFVLASSSSIYGDSTLYPQKESHYPS